VKGNKAEDLPVSIRSNCCGGTQGASKSIPEIPTEYRTALLAKPHVAIEFTGFMEDLGDRVPKAHEVLPLLREECR
jgi:hypothetical protein